MKSLTYKVIKNLENEERPVIHFEREHFIEALKKEIGLGDKAYEELDKFTVQLNSPTGRSCSFQVNAKDYVDNELRHIEKAIKEENDKSEEKVTFDIVTVQIDESKEAQFRSMIEKSDDFWEWAEEHPPLVEVKMEQKLENFKYFDVKLNGINYTVVLLDNETPDSVDQINHVKRHVLTVGERKRDFLTGLETIISYWQWSNIIMKIDTPKKDDFLSFEDINARMDNVFEGVDGLDEAKFF